jgi:hypothetical protein
VFAGDAESDERFSPDFAQFSERLMPAHTEKVTHLSTTTKDGTEKRPESGVADFQSVIGSVPS